MIGFSINKQKPACPAPDAGVVKEIKALNSEVISSILIYGEVSQISDRAITLTYRADELEVVVGENAKISVVAEGPLKESKFSDIKVGSRLSIEAGINSDGRLEASSVVILP